jgi:hypothetical protein
MCHRIFWQIGTNIMEERFAYMLRADGRSVFSDTLVTIYQITWCHIPDNINLIYLRFYLQHHQYSTLMTW